MTRSSTLCVITLLTFFEVPTTAQLLGGDPTLPVLNEIRWDMKADEIKSRCESRKVWLRVTDSTLVFETRYFDAQTRAKIQLDRVSQLPVLVEVAFERATVAIRDTIINHFTKKAGKPPLVTIKEKSAIIFTIKMEVASWRIEKEIVNVMTMMQGGEILGMNILVSKATTASKM